MLRGRNIENEKILGLSKMTHVSKFETQEESIQKEVDNYTRKFEEEKRKLFRAQENHREVLKEYQNQVTDLESMKTRKYKTETATLTAKIKCLEGNLEKNIAAYNQALAKNNSLKNEIDELRKDKKNQMQAYRKLSSKIEEITGSIKQKQVDIDIKKEKLQKNKEEILGIKEKNEKEHSNFKKNIDELGKSIKCSDPNKETMKNGMKTAETSDSQPLVKNRLRNLLLRNKEKIKICDSYKKNMEKIQQNFEEIRQRSGIESLEEIKKTFLKQDEQSTFIAEYISKLNGDLDAIREQNQILIKKIEAQEEKNQSYRSSLSGTPEDKRRRIQIEEYLNEKQKPIKEMNNLLLQVTDAVYKTLNKDFNVEGELNYFNYEQNLAELQKLIDEQFVKDHQKVQEIDDQMKDEATKYSRGIPVLNFEQFRDKNDQGLFHEGRLRDYASDFWDKKKQMRN